MQRHVAGDPLHAACRPPETWTARLKLSDINPPDQRSLHGHTSRISYHINRIVQEFRSPQSHPPMPCKTPGPHSGPAEALRSSSPPPRLNTCFPFPQKFPHPQLLFETLENRAELHNCITNSRPRPSTHSSQPTCPPGSSREACAALESQGFLRVRAETCSKF